MDLGYMVQSPTPKPPPEFQPPRNASLAHASWDRGVIDKKISDVSDQPRHSHRELKLRVLASSGTLLGHLEKKLTMY